jgi:hypothetical protein
MDKKTCTLKLQAWWRLPLSHERYRAILAHPNYVLLVFFASFVCFDAYSVVFGPGLRYAR